VVYDKFNGHCAYCGCELELKSMQVDHIFPQAKNHWVGSEKMQQFTDVKIPNDINDISNLNPACRACNYEKRDNNLETFRENLLHKIELLNKVFNYKIVKKFSLIQETEQPIKFYFEQLKEITK
jgi:5-methylcytosine-specific restriction endonuclease McrA